ncbi:methyltransferase domain-containing protein [Candidatus Parcubacteria bacterium]|nr:methyltransferase domain-containing protein [Candidatus Parcubacteria bacterium]
MDTLDDKVNKSALEAQVKDMYRQVAQNPRGEYHFEMGRDLAEKLGYPSADLDAIPAEAVESFAGVGYHFDLAALKPGEHALDVGSGSGTDVFFAARKVGPAGHVVGVDMTDEQLAKAEGLRQRYGFENVSFVKGYIEQIPVPDGGFDVAVSNGVINLSAEKVRVVQEVSRALKVGGRLAISDIMASHNLSERIKANAELWAACIGGAVTEQELRQYLEHAHLQLVEFRENPQYKFLTHPDVMEKYGIKSVSLLAIKTA